MLEVHLFGTTTVESGGRVLPPEVLRGRPRQILEILALAGGASVAKDRLADLVWDGDPPASHKATLESYVCVLRRDLGLRSGRVSELATSGGGYQLVSPAVWIDQVEFRQLAREAATAPAARAVALTLRALDLTRRDPAGGELLASEPYAGWADQARAVHAREAVIAYTHAAGLANGTQAFDSAAVLARAALGLDRLCEPAWQHLIRSRWFSGQHGEALRAYAELRAVMLEELCDEPARDSQQLYEAILREPAYVPAPHAEGNELRTLLQLLRQTLEATPGVRVPALDSGLSAAAMMVLSA